MTMATDMGATVQPGIPQDTPILAVGMQDPRRIAGAKSSNRRQSEVLTAQGQNIRIVSESDFDALHKISELSA